MEKRKKKVKKLNIKRTIIFCFILYVIGYCGISLINRPIRHIEIEGNNLITEAEILRISKLKDYPPIFKYSSGRIRKRIESLDLIEDVRVRKWFGTVKITITEKRILFYYNSTNKIVLSNGDIINNEFDNVYGIPMLTNTVKSNILKQFINDYKKLNDNIIYEIAEIEYYPKYNEDNKIISDDTFKIVMNDGNTIICNVNTVSVMNKYNSIFASLNGKYGTINLDSNKLENLIFIPYEE